MEPTKKYFNDFNTLSDYLNKNPGILKSSWREKAYISVKRSEGKDDWSVSRLGLWGRLARSLGMRHQDTHFKVVKTAIKQQTLGDKAKEKWSEIKSKWFNGQAKGKGLEELPNRTPEEVSEKLKRDVFVDEFPNIKRILTKEEKVEREGFFDETIKKQTEDLTEQLNQPTIAVFTNGSKNLKKLSPNMEDEHLATSFVVKVNHQLYPCSLMMVCDGHGNAEGKNPDHLYNRAGNEVAQFVKEKITSYIKKHLEQSKKLDDTAIFNALKNSCVELNKELRAYSEKHFIDSTRLYGDGSKTEGRFNRQGCTANINLIINDQLWTANIGDSRSILLTDDGQCIQLSEDAKLPAQAEPENRYLRSLKRRGGEIRYDGAKTRIKGVAQGSVPRAFGDFGLPGVSARPKIHRVNLQDYRGGITLIAGCDGVFDTVSTTDANKIAREEDGNELKKPEDIAEGLVKEAFVRGSGDNISVVVTKIN
jgi:serine/threonine protein phosphatase PrpC